MAAPRLAAVVLAAGGSRRMGENKLLADLQGRPLVAWAVAPLLACAIDPVVVVTGHQHEAVGGALADQPVLLVHNPDWSSGMGGSLRCGVRHLPDAVEGVLVVLGDMPFVRPAHLRALVAAFDTHRVAAPVRGGRRGHPVLWPRSLFSHLRALRGDEGARALLAGNPGWVVEVPVADSGVLHDIDTPAALVRARCDVDRGGWS